MSTYEQLRNEIIQICLAAMTHPSAGSPPHIRVADTLLGSKNLKIEKLEPRHRYVPSAYGQGELPACHVIDTTFYYKPTRFYGYDAMRRAQEYAKFLNSKEEE